MTSITLDFPENALPALRQSPEQFGRDLRLAAAVFWYQRREVSQEKAANIAGLSRQDFLEALGRLGVDTIQVDWDDLRDELSRG